MNWVNLRNIGVLKAVLFSAMASAQEPFFINYDIDDGFPSNNVYSISQDSDGIMWFGTDVGVVKYDGVDFQLFNTEDGTSDNEVFHIYEDHKRRKWLMTLNGHPCFIQNNIIYNQKNSELLKNIEGNSMIIDIFSDDENRIYMSYLRNKGLIIDDNDNVSYFSNTEALAAGAWESNDTIYSLTQLGIFNTNKNEFHKELSQHIPFRLFHSEDRVFYSDGNKLYEVNSSNLGSEFLEIAPGSEIIGLTLTNNDSLAWISSLKGLYLYKDGRQQAHYFKDSRVSDLLKDMDGNYWVTTLDEGVYFVPSFEVLQKDLVVDCMGAGPDGELWLGGIQNDLYFKKGDEFETDGLNPNWRKNNITNIQFYNDKAYVVAKSGVTIFSEDDRIYQRPGGNDIHVEEDSVFIASTHLLKVNARDFNAGVNIEHEDIKIIIDKRTKVLEPGNDGDLWIGTNLGLYKYNKSLDSLIRFQEADLVLNSSIQDISYDPVDDLLLVASDSRGFVALQNEKVKFRISGNDGLNNNTVNVIEPAGGGAYFVGTNNGINLVSFTEDYYEVVNYNAALGFKNKRIKEIAYINDTIYLATNDKLIYLNKSLFGKKDNPPKCLIEGVFLKNKNTPIVPGTEISYKDNDIKIKYLGISYLDEGDVTYYFKLNSKEENWSVTKSKEVNYSSMAPGTYEFSVYCTNGLNLKSEVQTIRFEVKKPLWQHPLLLALWGLIFILILWLAVRWRTSYLNKQFEKERRSLLLEKQNVELENQMLALEQKALRLQMNPHFIFNALNTIKGYYFEGNVRGASSYISKFSRLLRLLLENIEQYISLSTELEMLRLYLELTQVRYSDAFDYQIKVDPSLDTEETFIPTLLLQPMVENAVVHGVVPKKEKGTIKISFESSGNQLICSVEDNGVGIKKENHNGDIKHRSMALKITKERLDLLEHQENVPCELIISDILKEEKVQGTRVRITIPLIKTYD